MTSLGNCDQRRFAWQAGGLALSLLLLSAGNLPTRAIADVVQLANGGQLEGVLLPREAGSTMLRLRVSTGAVFQLDPKTVARIIREPQIRNEYRDRLQRVKPTPQAHWELAEWCSKNKLKPERERHLQRVIALHSDHVKARHALGYYQLRGEWVLPDEAAEVVGMFRHEGRRRATQEIKLMQLEAKKKKEEWDILRRLRQWRRELDAVPPDAQELLVDKIRQETKPLAIRPLLSLLEQERLPALRIVYIETLGAINLPQCWDAFIKISFADPNIEVFEACLAHLPKGRPHVLKQYVDALRSENNIHVNRGAIALAYFNDRSAITPLVDALITEHKVRIGSANRNGDAISTSFSSVGTPTSQGTQWGPSNPTMSAGKKDEYRIVQARNDDVLAALVKLTGGQSFGYDIAAWRTWLEVEQSRLPKRPR